MGMDLGIHSRSIGSNLSDANSTPLGYGLVPGIHLMEIFQIFQEMEMMPPTMIQTSLKIGLALQGKALFFDGVDDRVKLPFITP